MGWLLEKKKGENPKKCAKMGILAFETAKTMSKLVSLYNSLSDEEISSLGSDVPRSKGIVYLNSMDEGLVLSLACTERLDDLDKVSAIVSRLGHKCRDSVLKRFHLVYSDLKLGIVDLGRLIYGSKGIEKRVEKMKKMIATTSDLYKALEFLTELEVSEMKLKQWKSDKVLPVVALEKTNIQLFNQRIEQQRKQVRQLRENSLWNQTFDKSVSLMARLVCVLYARICVVFRPYIPFPASALPSSPPATILSRSQSVYVYPSDIRSRRVVQFAVLEPLKKQSRTVPFLDEWNKPSLYKSVMFLKEEEQEEEDFAGAKALKNNKVFHAAGTSTVGGCGLALRYANIIAIAENFLADAAEEESTDCHTRDYLYELLPNNLKSSVRSKLIKNMKKEDSASSAGEDELLAAGWREGMNEIMGWLAPMAHDTIQWQLERSPEKTKFDSKPTVLLLQTLHFSDKDKTEAAIAEVLVALSCICRYENTLHSPSFDS